ncbi:alpha-amylase family glycosyl hydrolase [Siphonobacter sp. SORGH_AS_0500]|uniref:alpha-amylase family glycosyl hydrolase n=1 Tax=Siphonobacter sp. SORGH_AS_0500 TaxID=1864824 RepID=UPI00285F6796|nr:alpha-amylase family glycosyl hydrolase [Siphonobacter sp. SORGH_AS_0500]MDR6198030.1 alpha-glucosidase [Siphonobacter sp. SORGH_AS_0500]
MTPYGMASQSQVKNQQLWWQSGIIYQIYPRSFQDSNADGIGDLQGVINRLDYLKWLGIQAVWLSPIYPSPMADYGYDISDYQGIHPIFGSMDDFDQLLEEVHQRGMKLILDLVPNHTSDQHPWFLESKSSRDNPKRDWYIWKDALPDGSEPNNWLAMFGGTAWEWDETTQQYYYHAFLKEQPDLNWRNPEVREAMMNVMHYWLKKGIDGFRVDVMWHMVKDAHFRNNPINPDYQPHQATVDQLLAVYSTDQPEVHDIVRQMREVLDAYEERMMIGEIYLPVHKLVTYYGENGSGAHLPFNFQLLNLPWNATQLAAAISQYEGALPEYGWPNWVLGNHDQPRITSRVGLQQARVAALLLLTLRGTPTIYYGDEIGMQDVPIPFSEVQDPQGLNMPDKNLSRDPARTPMQWNASTYAGFSSEKPWLRLSSTYRRLNVESEKDNPFSMLTLYKRLIDLRQKELSFTAGDYIPVYSDQQILAYKRTHENAPAFLIVLNLTHRPAYFKPEHDAFKGTIVLSTLPEEEGQEVDSYFALSGDQGIIIRLH